MRREDGFTLVGMMIAVAVVNIVLATVAVSWVTRDRRAREAELIWRGQQIARAIDCWAAGSAGQMLERLDQLVEAGCLRRVYRDPMVPGGQWRLLTRQDLADGTVAGLLGIAAEAAVAGAPGPSPALPGGATPTFNFSIGTTAGRQRNGPLGAGAGGDQAIIGVASTSGKSGLRVFAGRARYREWVFLGSGIS